MPEGILVAEAYPIPRCLVVPRGHPLSKRRRLSLEDIARYPLVAYDESYNSGWVVQNTFRSHGLAPRVAMRATDANVIKAYVAAGLGVAVLQQMAIEPQRDTDLAVVDTGDLFPQSKAQLSLRADKYLRSYMRTFIGMVPGLESFGAAG